MKNVKPLQIEEVKKKYEMQLLAIVGVEGVGIRQKSGKKYLAIYVSKKTDQLKKQIPSSLFGYSVRLEPTGQFNAL